MVPEAKAKHQGIDTAARNRQTIRPHPSQDGQVLERSVTACWNSPIRL